MEKHQIGFLPVLIKTTTLISEAVAVVFIALLKNQFARNRPEEDNNGCRLKKKFTSVEYLQATRKMFSVSLQFLFKQAHKALNILFCCIP